MCNPWFTRNPCPDCKRNTHDYVDAETGKTIYYCFGCDDNKEMKNG